jgi:lipoprotein-releasing system permease protein
MAARLFFFSPVERLIAWRYLRPRRKEGFISVIAGFAFLGIALGVATLIVVMSVMNGFRHDLLGRILGFNAHIVVVGIGSNIPDYEAISARIRKVKGVTSAVPVVDGQVMVTSRTQTGGAFVRGIKPSDMRNHRLLANRITVGAIEKFKDDTVIVGIRLANELGVVPGEKIRILSAQCIDTPFGCIPRVRTYTVVGTFNAGMSEYDRAYMFIPLESAQSYFNVRGQISNIEVTVEDPDKVNEAARGIVAMRLSNLRVRTWQDIHKTFFNALKVERNVMFLILTLIILIAAFNIVSSMILLVKDKTQAIAILRTMGATRATILRIFFVAGASIGVVGTLIGVGLGVLVADNVEAIKKSVEDLFGLPVFDPTVYFLSQLPSRIDGMDILRIAGVALGLSFLMTIFPAWRASRMDPVVALRND